MHVDPNALQQLRNVAELPIVHHHVAAMPDVHWGIGATVGSVIPLRGAIIPAAVGVDIGCGMIAVETTLRAAQLPDDLNPMLRALEAHLIDVLLANTAPPRDAITRATRKAPLKTGDAVPLTLVFEGPDNSRSTVTVQAPARTGPVADPKDPHAGHGDHKH